MEKYLPNTDCQQKEMLAEIGVKSIEELFSDIPEKMRLKKPMDLPQGMSELEVISNLRKLADKNGSLDKYCCFLGAGAYDHFIPSVVNHIISRSEFYTAYTPYQPEISQGSLQAIFEYQTLICELTGMDVANASMYDGATALAEAGIIACRSTERPEILIAKTVHPEHRQVVRTYGRFRDYRIVEIGYQNGQLDLGDLKAKISTNTAAVLVQTPNFLGVIESLPEIEQLTHQYGAMFIVSMDPIALALLEAPGKLGADFVVGEGQPLGNPLSLGGPSFGFFAATEKLMRKMPGRIVGQTIDKSGNRGYLLTLQSREQHIRREKATSNICSNQALNALAALVYLTVLGKQGLREVAELCLQKAHYAYEELIKTNLFKPAFTTPFFKEFAVKSTVPVGELNRRLLKDKIIGGYELGKDYPELADGWLLAVTEKRTKEEIDILVRKVKG